MNKDQRIKDILAKYGEDIEAATWRVQGQRVIYHAALERIAAQARIVFDSPTILRAEEREAVILVHGRKSVVSEEPVQSEWSIGEAHMDLNYKTSGKQQPYPYAMAEKRAKDRVILKLLNLHGDLYSEEEADAFKREKEEALEAGAATARDIVRNLTGEEPAPKDVRRAIMSDSISSGKPIQLEDGEVQPGEALTRLIHEQGTALGIKNLMLRYEVQNFLSGLPEDQREELRDCAKARMFDLGWGRKPKGSE
jgi:hypothetical protein